MSSNNIIPRKTRQEQNVWTTKDGKSTTNKAKVWKRIPNAKHRSLKENAGRLKWNGSMKIPSEIYKMSNTNTVFTTEYNKPDEM